MRKITLLLLAPFLALAQHNVTFQVDMNQYSGTFTTPEVNGEFNNWCGNCAPMSDANSDGIWDITIAITADSAEYKFSFDNWGGQEMLAPGLPCTKTNGSFTNRFFKISGDTTLPVVCWESCTGCTGTPSIANLTFQIDLSEYTGSYNEVNLNGTFNNWCGTCTKMTDANNDSIYEVVVPVPTADTIEYKFTLDGWTTDETLTQGAPCTKTTIDMTGTFTNRYFVPMADTTLAVVCWESCSACGTVGIEEKELLSNLSITPNPSNGLIYIENLSSINSSFTIAVYNMKGDLVYQREQNQNDLNQAVDLRTLNGGIYLLNISTGSTSKTERVLISR